MSDRAQAALWAHATYNRLPRHVRSLDAGAFLPAGQMLSIGRAREFFVLTEFAAGTPYAADLERMFESGVASPLDVERADALCDYLVEIHARKGETSSLWDRRIRDLVGHGECIMGLSDSYPPSHPWITRERLEAIERRAVEWRWRLKACSHRLCAVHGDFHPWNLLFREGTDFTALDRSRGEWGEAADDVVCLTINYLFFSLRRTGRFEGDLARLFGRFWERYLRSTGDEEILAVCAPFIAFRSLVMASPVWYPDLDDSIRRALFRFMERALDSPRFDPGSVEEMLR
jgi:aminoglycoside phosphotransferase (APT) family kinase protein